MNPTPDNPRTQAQGEYCTCAAIKLPDGNVITGRRHNNCISTIVQSYGLPAWMKIRLNSDYENGFMTNLGRFVNRIEGMNIQRAAGKPSKFREGGILMGCELYSEDLY